MFVERNSSAMRYSDKVKQFWRIGYKLFHGKWLRFMGGPKRRGQVVVGNTEKGNFKPAESEINFAVPRRALVSSELSPLSPEDVKPGILHTLLSKFAGKAEPQKTFKICIDGKKINAAITARVDREIPVAGIPSGNYREIPSWEILKILAPVGNTGKYDF